MRHQWSENWQSFIFYHVVSVFSIHLKTGILFLLKKVTWSQGSCKEPVSVFVIDGIQYFISVDESIFKPR